MAGDVKKEIFSLNPSISKFDEKTRKFITSKTVNILNEPQLMNIHNQHQWQHYELFREHEKSLTNKLISPILMQSTTSSIEQTDTLLIKIKNKKLNY
jgi:hypothetical protein